MPKVRTTLTIDNDVLRAVKVRAARLGRRDSDAIEDAIRQQVGLDLLRRLWDSSDLAQSEATAVAVEAQHATRRPLGAGSLDPNVLISAALAPKDIGVEFVPPTTIGEQGPSRAGAMRTTRTMRAAPRYVENLKPFRWSNFSAAPHEPDHPVLREINEGKVRRASAWQSRPPALRTGRIAGGRHRRWRRIPTRRVDEFHDALGRVHLAAPESAATKQERSGARIDPPLG